MSFIVASSLFSENGKHHEILYSKCLTLPVFIMGTYSALLFLSTASTIYSIIAGLKMKGEKGIGNFIRYKKGEKSSLSPSNFP